MAFFIHVKYVGWNKYLTSIDNVTYRLLRNNWRIFEQSADALHQKLISNITNQKFGSSYELHNDRYAKWKAQYGKGRGKTNFWELFGDLLRAIQVRPIQWKGESHLFVGIPPNVYDSGGKSWLGQGDKGPPKEILRYAIWMEKGRAGQPARSLFEPTQDEWAVSDQRTRIYNQAVINIVGGWR